jgi:hypothetical protein
VNVIAGAMIGGGIMMLLAVYYGNWVYQRMLERVATRLSVKEQEPLYRLWRRQSVLPVHRKLFPDHPDPKRFSNAILAMAAAMAAMMAAVLLTGQS